MFVSTVEGTNEYKYSLIGIIKAFSHAPNKQRITLHKTAPATQTEQSSPSHGTVHTAVRDAPARLDDVSGPKRCPWEIDKKVQ